VDTTNASGVGTMFRQGVAKHIFVMTPEGQIRAVDPWAARSVKHGQFSWVNHSSLVGGGDVAGAGERRIEGGKLQQVSDQSRHYQRNGQQVSQTLHQLKAMKVDLSGVALKLTAKKKDEAPLIIPAEKFLAYDNPKAAEDAIR